MKFIGMAVSLAGVAVISMGGDDNGEGLSIAGYAVAILSALLWAVYWLLNNRMKDRIDSSVALFLGFTSGSIALYIGLLFVPYGIPPVSTWMPCAYIGVMEMGLPFLLFAMALRNTDNPALVNQLCYLAPFISLFIISIVLKEAVTPMTYLGLTLIITGIMFNQYGAEWLSRRLAAMALAFFILPSPAHSQDPVVNVSLEARADWQHDRIDGENINDNSGFKGRYLNLKISGQINDQWGYNFRQRLNKTISEGTFFDATDWVYLTYSPTSRITFSAGKQVVAIGGYEYDRAPIDLYSCSEYWNNIACYQFGVSGAFRISNNDVLTGQVVASPFRRAEGNNNNMYAYNLMWNGTHGFYQSIWSANLIECMPGKYINYLALGNKFTFGIT
ncbi:MAG: EamA family transporter, partial [Muribaculaceae bacterium]|nr:EamA family transporter [Muribaculaceae bacterium]